MFKEYKTFTVALDFKLHTEWDEKDFFFPFILYCIITIETAERSIKYKVTLKGSYLCHSIDNTLDILNSSAETIVCS